LTITLPANMLFSYSVVKELTQLKAHP
jgi:hypothetical protein